MAIGNPSSNLPPGFELEAPGAPGALPAGFQLEAPAPMTGAQAVEMIPGPPRVLPSEPTTVGEDIVGAGEAGLTLATGATSGLVGFIGGTLKSVVEELRAGNFGSREAADRIEQAALEGAQALTYAPRTQAGQEQVKAVGESAQALAPLVGLAPQLQALSAGVQQAGTGAAVIRAAGDTGRTGVAIFKRQSPTKQRIARLIESGSTDTETARFRLTGPPGKTPPPQNAVARAFNAGGPRVAKDPRAINAIKQGFDEGVIATIKGASQADKLKMRKMVEIMETGKGNKVYSLTHRPSDVAGNTLLDRVKSIRTANSAAGKAIDRIAQTLIGQEVDISAATTQFAEALDNLGVQLVRNERGRIVPNFDEAQLSPGDRGPFKEVIRQMNIQGTGGIDAYSVHKMKRIIDNNVTFGKVKTGISGDGERVLKAFRHSLDEQLDNTFPAYNQANTVYAETITVLDEIRGIAGPSIDLSGGRADKALGTLLRRVMGNQMSRVRLIDAIDDIEAAARKHGGSDLPKLEGPTKLGDDDLLTQILFVDELDSVFGPVARTSFQGQIGQALKQGVSAATTKTGAVDVGLSVVGKAAEAVRGINEAGAFDAIKKLLEN